MNYNIKGTNVAITDELRSYVEKKLAAVEKFLYDAGDARVDVELEYIESEAKQYRAEFMLHSKHQLRATSLGGALYEAIDIAAGDLLTELTRAKKKRQSHFRKGAAKVKDFLRGLRKNI